MTKRKPKRSIVRCGAVRSALSDADARNTSTTATASVNPPGACLLQKLRQTTTGRLPTGLPASRDRSI